MDENKLRAALRDLTLGGLRFFKATGSTNDEALAWAASGAPDLSLVAADEQTSGRGRMGRTWFTPPGSALAFSLILRPGPAEQENIGRFAALGALALVNVLSTLGIAAQIKWPNDVLINCRKVAGILIETVWSGTEVDSLVLGMGVNVLPASLPPSPGLNFPVICIQSETTVALVREILLRDILMELIRLRAGLASAEFLESWQAALAFRGEPVQVWQGSDSPLRGELLGLRPDGSLLIKTSGGEICAVNFGEVHLRPL
jgi:BirA family biotin operon repressor/biotin-[acetyl-CoA-carboxylase] ligase